MSDDYVTIEQMAAMHKVAPNTIRRILWKDQTLPEAQRRLPGAVKEGSVYRGEWKIPRSVAENWQRDNRGKRL